MEKYDSLNDIKEPSLRWPAEILNKGTKSLLLSLIAGYEVPFFSFLLVWLFSTALRIFNNWKPVRRVLLPSIALGIFAEIFCWMALAYKRRRHKM